MTVLDHRCTQINRIKADYLAEIQIPICVHMGLSVVNFKNSLFILDVVLPVRKRQHMP